MKTAIIEKYPQLGGTCLNVGCIPSKSLLDSSHHYENALHNFEGHGISIEGKIKLDLGKMMSRKSSVVEQTTKGLEYLMNKNKVTVFNGLGSFKDSTTVEIKNNGKSEVINGKNIIIATGSKPTKLPFVEFDGERIISSTEALKLKEVPKHLVVIGGGVIGLELGQVYNRLGSKVTVVEYQDRIIPNMDSSLSKELTKVFKKSGVKVNTSHKVTSIERNGDDVIISAENKKGEKITFDGDYCLISVGRSAYTEGLDLEKVGITTDKYGRVEVDVNLKTNVHNIYAIGDVVRGAMLAHKAEEEGVMVAEMIAGQKPHIDYNLIPNVIYTHPEITWVGKNEKELIHLEIDYKSGSFPFAASGRALASGESIGSVTIHADNQTDKILGIQVFGPSASEIMQQGLIAMDNEISSEKLNSTIFSHPTVSEALHEAILAMNQKAIHILNRKKKM